MPSPESRTLTQPKLRAELEERFGPDPMAWAFVCPNCRDVATGQDFRDALAAADPQRMARDGTPVRASELLGRECIGRVLGALREKRQKDWKGRGCDWCAYGLFGGPWFIDIGEGRTMGCFPIAPAQKS